jgi:hypothetical protein
VAEAMRGATPRIQGARRVVARMNQMFQLAQGEGVATLVASAESGIHQ